MALKKVAVLAAGVALAATLVLLNLLRGFSSMRRVQLLIAGGLIAGVLAAFAALASAPSARAATPPTLQNEVFLSTAPSAVQATCDVTSDSTITFSVSGTAVGPYPGTYTETGTVTIGPQTNTGGLGDVTSPLGTFKYGTVISAHASFTINSPVGQVSGTKDLAATIPGTFLNQGICATLTSSSVGDRICALSSPSGVGTMKSFELDQALVSASYKATINTADGSFTDSGDAQFTILRDDLECSYGPPIGGSVQAQFSEVFTRSNGVVALAPPGEPCTSTSTSTNFNGTPIAAGNTLYFNSALKVQGLGSTQTTLFFSNQTVSFTADGTTYTLKVPNAAITFSPAAAQATTTYDAATDTFKTTTPTNVAGNVFLSALGFSVPVNLPGGIGPVTWRADVTSDTPGVTINWLFGAAVYTNFSPDYNSLGIKPVDDTTASIYQNADHAGTPENFKPYVIGGGTGGGGSNYTGSYSATGHSSC